MAELDLRVDEMSADALSAAVAIEIMGWQRDGTRWLRPVNGRRGEVEPGQPPAFATDASAAAMAFDRFAGHAWRWSIRPETAAEQCSVTIRRRHGGEYVGRGSSLALATCRAILKARRDTWDDD